MGGWFELIENRQMIEKQNHQSKISLNIKASTEHENRQFGKI